jgi:hypothetical protein
MIAMSSTVAELLDEALGMVARCGYQAYRNSCVGNPCPNVKAFYDRARAPQVGDIVLETSGRSTWRMGGAAGASLGRLVKFGHEPVMSEDELAKMHVDGDCWVSMEETIDEIPTEMMYHVQSLILPEMVTRWRNASFIALLEYKHGGDTLGSV